MLKFGLVRLLKFEFLRENYVGLIVEIGWFREKPKIIFGKRYGIRKWGVKEN